eukprot:6210294-Pleurochrysis_carterae.AAC.1
MTALGWRSSSSCAIMPPKEMPSTLAALHPCICISCMASSASTERDGDGHCRAQRRKRRGDMCKDPRMADAGLVWLKAVATKRLVQAMSPQGSCIHTSRKE